MNTNDAVRITYFVHLLFNKIRNRMEHHEA